MKPDWDIQARVGHQRYWTDLSDSGIISRRRSCWSQSFGQDCDHALRRRGIAREHSVQSLLVPEFGPLIGRNCVGAALSAVPFGRELWTARFCVVAQHSTFWVPGSSGTGKSWWARVAGFPGKYHAVSLASSRRSSAGRFGGACVIVVSLAESQAPGASPSSLLARCLSLCFVFSVFSVLCMLMSLSCVCACVLIRVLYSFACIL